MNDAERFEALERWLEKIEEFPGPVIIEGQRDIAALARFCELQLVSLNSGNSVLQTVERLAAQLGSRGRFAILTDWDRTGGRLARRLAELGRASDLQPDLELRRELALISRGDISCVEELPALERKLRSRQA